MAKVLARCVVRRGMVVRAVSACAAAGKPIGGLIRPAGSGVWRIRQRDLPQLIQALSSVCYAIRADIDPCLAAMWLRSRIVDCVTRGRSLIPGMGD